MTVDPAASDAKMVSKMIADFFFINIPSKSFFLFSLIIRFRKDNPFRIRKKYRKKVFHDDT